MAAREMHLAAQQRSPHRAPQRRAAHPAAPTALRSWQPNCPPRTGLLSSGAPSVERGRVAARVATKHRPQRSARSSVLDSLDSEAALVQRSRMPAASAESMMHALTWWDALPSRYKLLCATSLSFVICNMDKVNMSVAIIPMALELGLSPSVSGTVQASFFYGYMIMQLPGGYLAGTLGGRRVLPAGVALWSVMTCAVPALASTLPGLCAARAAVGLGEAMAPSAATDVIARTVPPAERSRAVALVFGGLHLGSIAGLLAAPALIHAFGWQSVFVAFGASGLLWAAWFESIVEDIRRRDPEFAARLMHPAAPFPDQAGASPRAASSSRSSGGGGGGSLDRLDAWGRASVGGSADWSGSAQGRWQGAGRRQDAHGAAPLDASSPVPYRAFFRSGAVQALCLTHFCHNWLSYSMLAWLPTFFTSTLSVDLSQAAQTALLPPLAGMAASAVAGPLADWLVERGGLSLGAARKLLQGASFLGPCALLLAAGSGGVAGDRALTLACVTGALGLNSLALGGLYCTHQDMSPKYASPLLGLTNTVGALPGIIGVAAVGYLYDATHSWNAALFAPSAACMLLGAWAYTFHARNDAVDFDALDNSPFWFEKHLPAWPSWLPRLRTGPAAPGAAEHERSGGGQQQRPPKQ